MTSEREHFEIEENCRTIHERDGWHCCYPGCLNTDVQIAHGIQKGDAYITSTLNRWNNEYQEQRTFKWIKKHVINHPFNVWTSCAYHNSKFNIGNNPGKVKIKLDKIRQNLILTGVIK
jgi:hypothetical protein